MILISVFKGWLSFIHAFYAMNSACLVPSNIERKNSQLKVMNIEFFDIIYFYFVFFLKQEEKEA